MKSSIRSIFMLSLCWLITSCGDKTDYLIKCDKFRIKTIFKDSLGDITGDVFVGNVQFLKDSITYEIISSVVTVPATRPIVTKNVVYTYTTQPFDLSGISDKETILVIYHLNSTVTDTLRMEIIDNVEFTLYNKGKLLDFAGTGDCELSLYIYR